MSSCVANIVRRSLNTHSNRFKINKVFFFFLVSILPIAIRWLSNPNQREYFLLFYSLCFVSMLPNVLVTFNISYFPPFCFRFFSVSFSLFCISVAEKTFPKANSSFEVFDWMFACGSNWMRALAERNFIIIVIISIWRNFSSLAKSREKNRFERKIEVLFFDWWSTATERKIKFRVLLAFFLFVGFTVLIVLMEGVFGLWAPRKICHPIM